jgi:hypothetical protein
MILGTIDDNSHGAMLNYQEDSSPSQCDTMTNSQPQGKDILG